MRDEAAAEAAGRRGDRREGPPRRDETEELERLEVRETEDHAGHERGSHRDAPRDRPGVTGGSGDPPEEHAPEEELFEERASDTDEDAEDDESTSGDPHRQALRGVPETGVEVRDEREEGHFGDRHEDVLCDEPRDDADRHVDRTDADPERRAPGREDGAQLAPDAQGARGPVRDEAAPTRRDDRSAEKPGPQTDEAGDIAGEPSGRRAPCVRERVEQGTQYRAPGIPEARLGDAGPVRAEVRESPSGDRPEGAPRAHVPTRDAHGRSEVQSDVRDPPPTMGRMSRQTPEPRQGRGPNRQVPGAPNPGDATWRWVLAFLVLILILALFGSSFVSRSTATKLRWNQLVQDLNTKQVASVNYDNQTGTITGQLSNGTSYTTTAPLPASDSVQAELAKAPSLQYTTPGSSIVPFLLEWLVPLGLFIVVIVWLNRRAQGQMSGIMSIGRSRAKVYSTERPRTTFADVAGYTGVKQEISEVVDFLKSPGRFKEIGARIPKGVLLVGPPGTGKTLLARAVAGEAGVPFLSVSGSDFMEMFVGVGASRVRDLFQTARKQAPAIIFVDEIDSIGRKRGAGLGGGHDEREQTLNQMLSEMDGFDSTEGVVMMAATNRPDILDPALLRPGRFDRQIVVPLPDLEERKPILAVHSREKRMGSDVDLDLVARGTPGMSGADLANLVNEAALHAVRRGSQLIEMRDFDAARDRVLMGQQRDSLVLTEQEKARVALHESGHAVLSYVLTHADPLLKVSIIPTGMALGVTQQLPLEERHIYAREYIEDSLCVRMGGRVAELLVYGDLSTGASDDLQRNTELARKMVREWGMSERVGPMAWGAQGTVFLGEDLMHSRDYSEDTSRVVDEEVARILFDQERRAREVLESHRSGLEAVTRVLLERETIDGEEVARLIDEAYGTPVHDESDTRAHFAKGISGIPVPAPAASTHEPPGVAHETPPLGPLP